MNKKLVLIFFIIISNQLIFSSETEITVARMREVVTRRLGCLPSDNRYLTEIENELVTVTNQNYELVQEKNRVERHRDIFKIGMFTTLIVTCVSVAGYLALPSLEYQQPTVAHFNVQDFRSRLIKKEYFKVVE